MGKGQRKALLLKRDRDKTEGDSGEMASGSSLYLSEKKWVSALQLPRGQK